MRTCEEYRELFDAYVAKELPRLERMELEAHIEQCPECADLLSEEEKLFGEELYTMPSSVSEAVMEKVNASQVGDLFTSEEERESMEMAVRRKMRKRDGIKSWILIAVVILFAVGYYFLEDYMLGKNSALKDMDSAPKEEAVMEESEEVVLEEDGVEENKGSATAGKTVLTSFRESLVNSDNITVKFGTTKVVLFEKFKMEYLADYIVSCPFEELQGRVTYKSIGSIKTDPDNGMNIQITDSHKIIFSMDNAIYEVHTEREDLLYTFEGVGILG